MCHGFIDTFLGLQAEIQPCSRHVIVFLSKGSHHHMKDALTVDVTGILYRWSAMIVSQYVQHLSTRLTLYGCNMRVRALQGDSAAMLRTFAHTSKTVPPTVYYLWTVLVATCGQETDTAVHSQSFPGWWMALCRKYGFSGTKTLNQIKPTLYTFGKHHIPLVMFYIILYFGYLHFIMLWLPKCVQRRNIKQ